MASACNQNAKASTISKPKEPPNFQAIPFELREKIWKDAAPLATIVELEWNHALGEWFCVSESAPPYPAILRVCKESRRVHRDWKPFLPYHKSLTGNGKFGTVRSWQMTNKFGRKAMYNPNVDMLYLAPGWSNNVICKQSLDKLYKTFDVNTIKHLILDCSRLQSSFSHLMDAHLSKIWILPFGSITITLHRFANPNTQRDVKSQHPGQLHLERVMAPNRKRDDWAFGQWIKCYGEAALRDLCNGNKRAPWSFQWRDIWRG